MTSVTVYLNGNYAPGNKDWDRGYLRVRDATKVVLQDNDYGLNMREYPIHVVTRINYN